MDEATKFKWSFFVKNKSDLTGEVIKLLRQLKTNGIETKFIRCDNALENKSLDDFCVKKGLKVKFEYMARQTPQQNGVVESAFQSLYNNVQAMLNKAGFNKEIRGRCGQSAQEQRRILRTFA